MYYNKNDFMNSLNKLKNTISTQLEKRLRNVHLPSREEIEEKFKYISQNYEKELAAFKKKYEQDFISLRKLVEDAISKAVTSMTHSPRFTPKKRARKKAPKITSRERE
jgi:hypothetical protein